MKLNKFYRKALIPLLAIPLLGLPQAAGAAADSAKAAEEAGQTSEMEIIQEVLNYLDAYNIEGADRELFLENAIRGMVYTLDDPYSDYYTAEELAEFEDSVNQEFVGIGVTLRFTGNKLYITDVLPGSPAGSAGLKKGDIIAKVDGEPVKTGEDILRIQGEENTKVLLGITRGNQNLSLSVKRSHFSLPSVTGSYIPSGRIGYITLSSFSENADKEFAAELDKLRKAGMRSMVLDLRDNLGGYVDSAANIAKYFMKSGTLMYTSGQNGELEAVTISGGQDIGMPVVILTNELTASASEILTGALHDNGIATVVGTQTYGKARIQNVFTLSNGSSLKLTVQRYFTPKREDFNHVGLKPDIEVMNNATAQLITALNKAGARTIELSGNASSLTINGVAFSGYVDTLQSGDKLYVPSRILAALLKGDVAWSASTQKLTVTNAAGSKAGFTIAAKTAKMIDGETYVEIHEFQKKFPDIKWSFKQGTLHLSK
ncbi:MULTISPECIES: S41 family peptidase [Paenibacillus]|uniref:PDZ domain-containing protein n=1 Tax=Paenibacillus vini TaxID=1476024 RepID=A0ABQ4MG96_9BACL|nr:MULTISPECIES: S41 family peptidase [Paenibacillus]MBQ4901903.1 PDZ domain-containing protein [Paenibacillus sp. Marseille-P2973]GIP54687.1 hypothetical protein J42TS3_37220 [Paenibacillus vini]